MVGKTTVPLEVSTVDNSVVVSGVIGVVCVDCNAPSVF